MPDIIKCDILIRTCMLENNLKVVSSIDINCEGMYQLWSLKRWK